MVLWVLAIETYWKKSHKTDTCPERDVYLLLSNSRNRSSEFRRLYAKVTYLSSGASLRANIFKFEVGPMSTAITCNFWYNFCLNRPSGWGWVALEINRGRNNAIPFQPQPLNRFSLFLSQKARWSMVDFNLNPYNEIEDHILRDLSPTDSSSKDQWSLQSCYPVVKSAIAYTIKLSNVN